MARNKGNSIIAFPRDFVVLDIETTGFSPVNDRIIEFAALKVVNGEVVDTYSTLVNPCMIIRRQVQELTGICNLDVEGEPEICEVIDEIASFIGSDIVVAYNAHFDVNFLYEDFYNYCGFEFNNDFVDPLKIARKLLPELENHKLGTVASHLGIEVEGSHRALDDCITLLHVFNRLRDEKGSLAVS